MSIVCKFGGSSLATAESVKTVAEIIKTNRERKFIVVSAMGSAYKGQKKITDLLFEYHNGNKDAWTEISIRHNILADELKISGMRALLYQTKQRIDENNYLAYTVSRGEYLMANMISAYLGIEIIYGTEFIRFNQNGEWNIPDTLKLSGLKLKNYDNGIIPGYYGSDSEKNIHVFSRGGCDITGAIVAYGVEADLYENWTDVDGFMTTDPVGNDEARIVRCISYNDLTQLSFFGANVLHYQTVIPLILKAIPLNIRNTFNLSDQGTMVTYQRIEGIKGFAMADMYMLEIDFLSLSKIAEIINEEDIVYKGVNKIFILTKDESKSYRIAQSHAVIKMRIFEVNATAIVCHNHQNLNNITEIYDRNNIEIYFIHQYQGLLVIAAERKHKKILYEQLHEMLYNKSEYNIEV